MQLYRDAAVSLSLFIWCIHGNYSACQPLTIDDWVLFICN